MLLRISLVLVALAVVIGIPFALRPAAEEQLGAEAGADRLIVVTPHNEAIRHEFTVAFRRHYRETTGRDVALDWRVPGGTSEIARYLASEFTAAFQNHWVNQLGRKWDSEVDAGFDNRTLELPEDVEARLHVDGGLGTVEVDSRFERDGKDYVTAGYDDAAERVEIDIDGGVGTIRVK